MNILVTGGAGFIGSNLVDTLMADGHQVIVVDNFNDYYSPEIKEHNVSAHLHDPKYCLIRGDIENLDVVQQAFGRCSIDCVVHLAARAGVRPSLENPMSYVKTNILGTMNILETMKQYKVKKLVFASSSSVYGNCPSEIFSEDLKVTEPISPYAATKSAGEQLCYTYSHLYDLQVVCLRFFTVYGPRQRPDLAIRKFVERIRSGLPIEMYGDGSTKRDYTYVSDIVSGIRAAMRYDSTQYEIVNIGGGEPITLLRMISTIEKVLCKKATIVRKPMQPGDVVKTVCDWSKAKRLFGYEPNTTFEEGIRRFVEWEGENARV